MPYRRKLGGQGVRRIGPGEYLGCYRSRTRPATITRCVHLSIRLLFADDNRLLRELQVSYDGFNDGKYSMVMAGHLMDYEIYERKYINRTTRSKTKTSKNSTTIRIKAKATSTAATSKWTSDGPASHSSRTSSRAT